MKKDFKISEKTLERLVENQPVIVTDKVVIIKMGKFPSHPKFSESSMFLYLNFHPVEKKCINCVCQSQFDFILRKEIKFSKILQIDLEEIKNALHNHQEHFYYFLFSLTRPIG